MIRAARTMASLCLGLAAVTHVTGSPARADDLASVVQGALAGHPELGAIRFNRRAIDHELTAARGLYLPTVDVRSDLGRHRDYNKSELGITSGDEYHRHREHSVHVSQRLFDGFEAIHEEARQKHRVESARWRVNDTANTIALRAVQSYLELQRAQAVLKAARANLAAHHSLLSRVGQRVDAGRGNSADRSEAIGRTAHAQALASEAEQKVADAIAFFQSVAGRAPGALRSVSVPTSALPRTVEEAVAEARIKAPSEIATTHDTTAAAAAIGVANARFMPKLNAEFSSDHSWGMSAAGDRSIDTRGMLVVRWNLFNGGIDKARVWEAKARALEAAEISENTRRIVERETRVSWNAIQAANARTPALTQQLQQNRSTREAYASQFNAGQRRLLDLLNIQAEVFVAEATLRSEELSRVYNSYRVLAAMGQLVAAIGLEMPPEGMLPRAPRIVDGWRDGWANWSTNVRHHGATDDTPPAPTPAPVK